MFTEIEKLEMKYAARTRERYAIAEHLVTENDVNERHKLIARLIIKSEEIGYIANQIKTLKQIEE